MGFFDDDPFDEIVREFFGKPAGHPGSQRSFIKGESNERSMDFVETDEKLYFVFELPGYEEEDISVSVRGKELEVMAKKKNLGKVQHYLSQKLSKGVSIKKQIPKFVKAKNYNTNFKNGILEVEFDKK